MLVHKGGKIKNWGGECRDVTPTKSLSQNIRVDVNREVKFFCFFFVFVFFFLGGGGGGWVGGGIRVDVNQELKFFGKFKKKNWGEGVGWVHGGPWKFLVKSKKKYFFFWGGGVGGGGQSGCEQ